jgi:hypothetical protein
MFLAKKVVPFMENVNSWRDSIIYTRQNQYVISAYFVQFVFILEEYCRLGCDAV